MTRVALLMFVVQIGAAAAALISCLSTEDDKIQKLSRIGWIILILLFPLVGALVWFAIGRPRAPRPRVAGGAGGRVVAPDDDPDFLRSLDDRRRDRKDDDPEQSR
ncbi:PLD nuclease N-terminal domain-containing protein [Pilimelia columellifera]